MFPLDIIGVTNETRHEGVWHKEEKQKKGCFVGSILLSTEDRNRTDTRSPSPDFESGASTSSATPANEKAYNTIRILSQPLF